MNALLSARLNRIGSLSPTPEQRAQAAEQVKAMAKATILGRMTDLNSQAAAASSGPKAATKAATKSEETDASAAMTDAVNNELDRDAFLNLLVMQMQQQDPLSPMDNTQMIAQLAEFSALEQMNNMATSFEGLATTLAQQNLAGATALIGREVTGLDLDGNEVAGTVDRVHMVEGDVYLTVGAQVMGLDGVATVAQPAPQQKGAG
jgi:flagellar basal-body rod modification protein FlgD